MEEEDEEEEDDDDDRIIVGDDRLERVIDEIVQEIIPKSPSPTPPPIESDSDLSIEMGDGKNGKVKFEPTPPPYESNDMDGVEETYSDDVIIEPPKPDMMEEITPTPPEVESTPEPQALPVTAFKFHPYVLPPPEPLSQNQSNSLFKKKTD